jgi:flagellar motility protein MotE (MotC chaperone)
MPALLKAIQEREAQIAEREAYIDRRMQTLAVAEQRIREQMDALTEAESKLAATLNLADNATEEDVARLTEVYQRMKPTEAAGIFETMDIQFAAGFFSRMRPESSAAIMANLPADLAYSISVVMAGRNANAPRE